MPRNWWSCGDLKIGYRPSPAMFHSTSYSFRSLSLGLSSIAISSVNGVWTWLNLVEPHENLKMTFFNGTTHVKLKLLIMVKGAIWSWGKLDTADRTRDQTTKWEGFSPEFIEDLFKRHLLLYTTSHGNHSSVARALLDLSQQVTQDYYRTTQSKWRDWPAHLPALSPLNILRSSWK